MPDIDILIVIHNSARFIQPLIESLRRITVPINLFVIDNASSDKSKELLAAILPSLAVRSNFFESPRNHGFAKSVNLLARQGSGEFIFLLNPDTELEENCLERLLACAMQDPAIGMCEARQLPREHPKVYDLNTGETTWCTGTAVLIRRKAFEELGGFDERIYFMYCEDVDLSWKFWLRGWKCIYVRDAVVRHYTADIIPGKKRTIENYFSFRNSLFLFYRFGRWNEKRILYKFLLNRFVLGNYSVRSRVLYAIALVDHLRYVPYLLRTRHFWCDRRHPWIRLRETSLAH
jgi:GT2 family glycosyltransferase